MSSNNPPNPYFSNIDYNNAFYSSGVGNYITLPYANSHYLFSTGIATSTATTTFSSNIGIGTTASSYQLDVYNGTPLSFRVQSGSSNGSLVLGGGNSGSLGYYQFVNPSGTTIGYIGGGTAITNYIDLSTGNGYLGYRANNNFIVSNQLAVGFGTNPINSGTALTVTGTTVLNSNVGIGTTYNSSYSLDIYNTTAPGNYVVRLQSGSGNGQLVLSPGLSGSLGYVSFFNTAGTQAGYVGYGVALANYIDLSTQNGYLGYRANGNLIVASQLAVGANTINSGSALTVSGNTYINGNVGIGTTNPTSYVHIHKTTPATDVKIQLTDGTTGTTTTNGFAIIKTGSTQDAWIQNYQNANLNLTTAGNNINFYVNSSTNIATINSSGLTVNGTSYLNGSLGIGTSVVGSYLLYVNGLTCLSGNVWMGTNQITAGTLQIMGGDGGTWVITYGTSYNSVQYSLLFTHTGYASYYISGTNTTNSQITSDQRVKTDITNISNSLDIINKLEPKNFNLLDDKDKVNLYGFIAQDVEQTLPQLVRTEPNYIANIYSNANYNNDTKIITIDKDITTLLKVGDKLKIILDYDKDELNEVSISNDCMWYNRYKKRYVTIKSLIDSNNFTIEEDLNVTEQIFIYGIYADDFKTLDYNSLFAINTQAIKDLYAIIQSQQAQINQLLNK